MTRQNRFLPIFNTNTLSLIKNISSFDKFFVHFYDEYVFKGLSLSYLGEKFEGKPAHERFYYYFMFHQVKQILGTDFISVPHIEHAISFLISARNIFLKKVNVRRRTFNFITIFIKKEVLNNEFYCDRISSPRDSSILLLQANRNLLKKIKIYNTKKIKLREIDILYLFIYITIHFLFFCLEFMMKYNKEDFDKFSERYTEIITSNADEGENLRDEL